jgi:hypothetical protein
LNSKTFLLLQMAFTMPQSPLASLACLRRSGQPQHWLFVLLLLGALAVAQARAGPDANPKPKAQNEVENYSEYNEYGEDIYGEQVLIRCLDLKMIFKLEAVLA